MPKYRHPCGSRRLRSRGPVHTQARCDRGSQQSGAAPVRARHVARAGCARAAGLSKKLRPDRHAHLVRPRYSTDAQPGTRIRNGPALRAFNLELAAEVARSLERRALPVSSVATAAISLAACWGCAAAVAAGSSTSMATAISFTRATTTR